MLTPKKRLICLGYSLSELFFEFALFPKAKIVPIPITVVPPRRPAKYGYFASMAYLAKYNTHNIIIAPIARPICLSKK